jgi:DNA repair protein RadA
MEKDIDNIHIEGDPIDTMSEIIEEPIEEVTDEFLEEETEEVEEEKEPVDLQVDQLEGVGAVTKKKLEAFGIKNLIDICVRGGQEVSEITGVDKSKANNWVFNSQKILEDNDLVRKTDMEILDLLDYQEKQPRLASKCEAVDGLFGGGLVSEAVYEVYGEFGCGKTQLCLSLTAEAISQGEDVVWIDCEDTFKPRRLREILIARELATDENVNEMLDHVKYFYTPNTEQLMGTVDSLSQLMQEMNVRLLVIDGSIGQFREEYLGRGHLSVRQNQIARLMTHIKNISFYFRCVVLFTNQVQSDPSVMFGDPVKPIGGNIVAHASTYRVYFKKAGKKRIARMIDSPEHEMTDAPYSLTVRGIEDVEA